MSQGPWVYHTPVAFSQATAAPSLLHCPLPNLVSSAEAGRRWVSLPQIHHHRCIPCNVRNKWHIHIDWSSGELFFVCLFVCFGISRYLSSSLAWSSCITIGVTLEPKTHSGDQKASSTNGAGETEKPPAKEWNYAAICHHIQKLTQKCTKDLNVRPDTRDYIEENLGAKLRDLGLREDFMNLTSKAREAKVKRNRTLSN